MEIFFILLLGGTIYLLLSLNRTETSLIIEKKNSWEQEKNIRTLKQKLQDTQEALSRSRSESMASDLSESSTQSEKPKKL